MESTYRDANLLRNTPPKFIIINGGRELSGEIFVSGSKNATFPILAASFALSLNSTIENVPNVSDVDVMLKILENFGVEYERKNNTLFFDATRCYNSEINKRLAGMIRGSVLLISAVLGRFGRVKMPPAGGCAIGNRPIDQHIKTLETLGINVKIENDGSIYADCEYIKGGTIKFDKVTVTGTENALILASLSDEIIEIQNAALEPEINELCKFLVTCGAKIEGIGSRTISIKGRANPSVKKVKWKIIPDRIEAGTWAVIASATEGEITIKNAVIEHLDSVLRKLEETGVTVNQEAKTIKIKKEGKRKLKPVDVYSEPFPGFPTDLQSPIAAYLSQIDGTSKIIDSVFPSRFSYAEQLAKFGAEIEFFKGGIIINGRSLRGCDVTATDLRAAASLIVAGLTAEGKTVIRNPNYLFRGYDSICEKLLSLGADISVK